MIWLSVELAQSCSIFLERPCQCSQCGHYMCEFNDPPEFLRMTSHRGGYVHKHLPKYLLMEKNVEYTSNATSKSWLAKLLGPNLAAKLLPSSYPTDVCIKLKNHHSYGIHISDMSHFLKDFRLKTGDVQVLTCFKMHSIPIHIWLVVYLPLWKIWVRQIGSSQPLGTIKVMFQTTNQI